MWAGPTDGIHQLPVTKPTAKCRLSRDDVFRRAFLKPAPLQLSCDLIFHLPVWSHVTSCFTLGDSCVIVWACRSLPFSLFCRNKSSCSKIAMRLKVLQADSVVRDVECEPPVAAATSHVVIPLQEDKVLECPGLHEVTKMADSEPTVKWVLVKSRSVTQGSLKVSWSAVVLCNDAC